MRRWQGMLSPVGSGRCGRIHENVVLLKFLDIALHLVQLLFEVLLAVLFAERVQFAVVRLSLVLKVKRLPFSLQGRDQLLTLFLWHEHLLLVTFVLLFNLHLANQVVLVLDFVLDFGQVPWGLAVSLLLEHVLLLAGREFWCCQDVLNSVGHDEVLVRHKSVNWLLVALRDGLLLKFWASLILRHLCFLDEDWVSSSLLLEHGGVGLEGSLRGTESSTSCNLTVSTAF